ncbi:MAG: hypothetical protein U1E27_04065 [Kiritimatiellia bacterium]|nr:hypothetical protein [Kiritimatiellia bacterium]
MDKGDHPLKEMRATSRRLARLVWAIGENRMELLMAAVQEERERSLHAILLTLMIAGFGFLAGISLSAVLVVLGWAISPVGVLIALSVVHGAIGFALYRRLIRFMQEWQFLGVLRDQIRADGAALEKALS